MPDYIFITLAEVNTIKPYVVVLTKNQVMSVP